MKVWGINHQPSGRATKLRGRMIAVKDKRLGWRIQSWPRKRGQYQSERQRQWGEWFAAVNGYLRQPDALTYKWAKDLTDGTIFMPRDLLLKLSAGRFWTIELEGGGAIYSEQLMADQVQALLDTITTVPGSIIYRAPDGWRALLPGTANDVLTTTGDAGSVAWQALPTPASGSGLWAAPTHSSPSPSPYCCFGKVVTPLFPMKFTHLWTWLYPTTTANYYPVIFKYSGSTVTALLYQAAPVSIATPVDTEVILSMSDSPTLTPGSAYCVGLARDGSTAGGYIRIGNTSNAMPAMPVDPATSGIRITGTKLAVGSGVQLTGNNGLGFRVEC